jgi:hypothetical protein
MCLDFFLDAKRFLLAREAREDPFARYYVDVRQNTMQCLANLVALLETLESLTSRLMSPAARFQLMPMILHRKRGCRTCHGLHALCCKAVMGLIASKLLRVVQSFRVSGRLRNRHQTKLNCTVSGVQRGLSCGYVRLGQAFAVRRGFLHQH